MKKMNPVVHFEMAAEDKDRVSKFYTSAFGWDMQTMGHEYGGYTLATTTETDKKTTRPKNPGAINGGFYHKEKGTKGQNTHIVISVDDLKESIEAVKKAGGKVIGGQKPGEPDDIPGVGLYISFEDTEGNIVGMLQPAQT